MKNTNFDWRFRCALARYKSDHSSLMPVLQSIALDHTAESFGQFPFILVMDIESQLVESHLACYLKDNMQWERLAISHTDAYWLQRIGVRLISPFSIIPQAATMSIAFGILLPIFKEHFSSDDPARSFALLLMTCLVIYPMAYKFLNLVYTKRNPKQRNFPDYSPADLMKESFRLFTILICALTGLELFSDTLYKTIAATAIAAPVNEFFKRLPSLSECSPTIALEALMGLINTCTIFGTLLAVLQTLPKVLPDAATKIPWLPLIRGTSIFLALPLYVKLIGTIISRMTNCFYVLEDDASIELPTGMPQAAISNGHAANGNTAEFYVTVV